MLSKLLLTEDVKKLLSTRKRTKMTTQSICLWLAKHAEKLFNPVLVGVQANPIMAGVGEPHPSL